MRVVIQRVSSASVEVEKSLISNIGQGLLILLGVESGDSIEDQEWLVSKISNLRIFNDENGVMNLSVKDVKGELLCVSQFTLTASTRKGNRPSYIRAESTTLAEKMYEDFCSALQESSGIKVKKGIFGADMKVTLTNDGPVTIIIDSRLKE